MHFQLGKGTQAFAERFLLLGEFSFLLFLPLPLSVHEPLPPEVAEAVGRGCLWEGQTHQEGQAERGGPPAHQAPQRPAGSVEDQSSADGGDPGGGIGSTQPTQIQGTDDVALKASLP